MSFRSRPIVLIVEAMLIDFHGCFRYWNPSFRKKSRVSIAIKAGSSNRYPSQANQLLFNRAVR